MCDSVYSDLETQINEINANPRIGIYVGDPEVFNASVEAWRSDPSIDNLWQARESMFLVAHYDVLDIIPSILPSDRTALLNCLDRFDFPHPICQVLRDNTILQDRDEIAAVLKEAPICSEDGQSWNRRLLALLVLKTAEEHCHNLWQELQQAQGSNNDDPNILETTKTTLESWFEELGHIVMDRPDSQFLGPQWLLMKVTDERQDRARHSHTGDQPHKYLQQADLINWIARGLSKAGLTAEMIAVLVDFPDIPDTDEFAQARSESHDHENTPSRLGALSMMGLIDHIISGASTENGQPLLDHLDALLAYRDPIFEIESLMNSGTSDLPASCCGYLLANEEDPAKRWRQSWDRLIEQRRRAQHWHQTNDSDALAPSLFLLAVGTSSIDWLLSPPQGRPDKAKNLWRELFDGTRDCWLTIPLIHLTEHIETHIMRLFARHPIVFGNSVSLGDASESNRVHDANSYSERLAQDLDLLGGDDRLLTICCLNASGNGATPEVIDKVLKRNSGHLHTILRQFEQWQKLERSVRKRTDIVEALAKLRQEIKALPTKS